MTRWLLIILSLILLSGLVFSGCSNVATITAPATTKATTTTTAKTPIPTAIPTTSSTVQPVTGGTLRVIVSATDRNLGDPGSSGIPFRGAMIEPLTSYDKNMNVIPWLLTSWVLDPDAKTMTFKVRQGVKFHDGTILNAEAVKWNWEQKISYGGLTGGADLKSIDVLDDYTVRLSFNKYSAFYLITFTNVICMLSPTAVKTNGKDWARTHCVGTGSFKQADFKADSYLKMVRNDDYWGTRPYLDGITQTVVSDATVASLTMRNKDADMWDPANIMETASLRDQGGYQIKQVRASVIYLAGDSANPNSAFANKKVREALEYALDRDQIAKVRGFGGMYEAMYQFANPEDRPYDPDITVRKYDPAKARQLLAEAGYPNGFKTTLLCANDQQTVDTCTLVQSYLAAVGIQVTIDAADTARRQSMVFQGGTGWTGLVWGQTGYGPGIDFVRWTILNTFSPLPKAQYTSVLKSPEYTALWNQATYLRTLPEAEAIGKKLVRQMFDDAMVVPMYTAPYSLVTQNYVHTNLLSIHFQIWNPELDWMEKH